MNDDLVSLDDAYAIGMKIVECAERVRVVDMAMPGSRALWGFEMEGVKYRVTIEVDRDANAKPKG